MSSKRARTTTNSKAPFLACKRCRARKVKCDGEDPSCTGCLKAGVSCIILDDISQREYTRSEVRELEERLARLEAEISASSKSYDLNATPNDKDDSDLINTPRFVGPETGTHLFRKMLDAFQENSDISSHGLLKSHMRTSIVYHEPHSLPSAGVASDIVSEYFREFHVRHPFLTRKKISRIFDKLYTSSSPYQSNSLPSLTRLEKQELFQVNMVLAIGSTQLFRNGTATMHPFGYFTAALKASPPSVSCFGTIEDLENFILIAHFGVYYNIGCSIWELSRLCVRMCVEHQLHRKSPRGLIYQSAGEQKCRLVFWESYLLDRFSSSTLGRPFAIEDSVIDAPLPSEIWEGNPGSTCDPATLGQGYAWNDSEPLPDVSVFIHLIKLAQITSAISKSFNNRNHISKGNNLSDKTMISSQDCLKGSGEAFMLLFSFNRQLQKWRQDQPVFEQPTCVYQTEHYFELSFLEAKFRLFRAVIDSLPVWASSPPEILLLPCLKAACRIILTLNKVRDGSLVGATRAYTHLIFMTSLYVIFSIYLQAAPSNRANELQTGGEVVNWPTEFIEERQEAEAEIQPFEALFIAERIILSDAERMPDMETHARIFQMLKKEVEGFISRQNDHGDATLYANYQNSIPGANHEISINGEVPHLSSHSFEGDPSQENPVASNLGFHNELPSTDLGPSSIISELFDLNGAQWPGQSNQINASTSWPFHAPWMEEIGYGLSSYMWDTMVPWQQSPSM